MICRKIELRSRDGSLLLRPYQMSDVQAIYEAVRVSIDELMPWMTWCHPDYSRDETKNWLRDLPEAWQNDDLYGFGIFDNKQVAFLGGCGLSQINRTYQLANLGYWVKSDRTGEGIATDDAKMVARFGFETVGLKRIEIVAAVANVASRRVAENSAAHFEGILPNRMHVRDRIDDAAMYSLIPEDLSIETVEK